MDLFYPELAVQIGAYCFRAGVRIMAVSCRDSSFDWAKIRFTEQMEDAVSLSNMDEVTILMGYNGGLKPVFTGYVTDGFAQAGGANELLAKDAAIKLETVTVSNTFINVQPQEIVEYCCRRAELECRLPTTQYPRRSYVAMNENALQVIEHLGVSWGISPSVFCRNGILHWNAPAEQTRLYVFEYGRNIISLTRESGYRCLETVATPFIRHSDRIGINHPQLSGSFIVYKVVFSSTEQGFLRTRIYFKETE